MIEQIIIEYLKSNKRLVVPDFGTFIRKDGGEIVFVEFMKKDDGVLCALIADKKGYPVAAAMSEIGLYTANIKRTIEAKGEYFISGLGRIYKTAEGTLELDHTASGISLAAAAPTSPAAEKNIVISTQDQTKPQSVKQTVVSRQQEAEPVRPKQHPNSESNDLDKQPRAERVAADKLFGTASGSFAQKIEIIQPRTTDASSQQMDFESSRNRDIFAANAAASRQGATPAQNMRTTTPNASAAPHHQQRPPRPRPAAPAPKRKKADMVMIIAILAAVIAIVALGYNMWVSNGPAESIRPTNYLEQQTQAPSMDDPGANSVE